MRTPIVAANWKMNPPPAGWDDNASPYRPREGADVIVLPPFTDIAACVQKGLKTCAQTARPEQNGAFTGDVSVAMVARLGCTHLLCGHSERRLHHGETDTYIASQAQAAIDAGLIPIVCIGETKEERTGGHEKKIVERQLKAVLKAIARPDLDAASLVIAYEPVWAIGTGETAEPEDVQVMHGFIRSLLHDRNAGLADVRILYGGSVKPEGAPALIEQLDIDGFLVGGASLDPMSFSAIADAVGNNIA